MWTYKPVLSEQDLESAVSDIFNNLYFSWLNYEFYRKNAEIKRTS
jgi:hypothetical protein